jgi:hypothetical protein
LRAVTVISSRPVLAEAPGVVSSAWAMPPKESAVAASSPAANMRPMYR